MKQRLSKMRMVNSKKVNFFVLPSFRRRPESSNIKGPWMPDQVRHDDSMTFYESVKNKFQNYSAKFSNVGAIATNSVASDFTTRQ